MPREKGELGGFQRNERKIAQKAILGDEKSTKPGQHESSDKYVSI